VIPSMPARRGLEGAEFPAFAVDDFKVQEDEG
jgi:hypothetical protein